jgi:hypothetical protein
VGGGVVVVGGGVVVFTGVTGGVVAGTVVGVIEATGVVVAAFCVQPLKERIAIINIMAKVENNFFPVNRRYCIIFFSHAQPETAEKQLTARYKRVNALEVISLVFPACF